MIWGEIWYFLENNLKTKQNRVCAINHIYMLYISAKRFASPKFIW